MTDHDDFAFDHAPGLPEPLPAGETLLWQGSPDWRELARRPFRVRLVALWFAGICAWLLVSGLYRGESLASLASGIALTAAGGAVATGVMAALAYATARSTLWSITTKRVLIRFGIALPVDMNLPFVRIRSAGLALDDGPAGEETGTIALELVAEERVTWGIMWPHVGPSPKGRTRPALRAVPRAREVARLLGDAVTAAGGHARRAPGAASAATSDALPGGSSGSLPGTGGGTPTSSAPALAGAAR